MAKFNDVLRSLREDSGLTQKELAQKLGLAYSTISMYERGEREPNFETMEAIADFFNVDMNYLTGKSSLKNGALPELEEVYFSFAKSAQDQGIEPSDIEMALEYIKKIRSKE